jgi:putative endonuclease
MTEARRTLGQAAEDAAAAFLERAGLRVVERNVRFREGELDLVVRDHDVWVFVEVKCRQARWRDGPGAAVSWHKQRRLTRLAEHYLKWRRLRDVRCRFDVVEITVEEGGRTHVRHLTSAFDAV